MTPPGATGAEAQAGPGSPPAVSVCPLVILRERADFVAMSRATKAARKGLILQAAPGDGATIRVGYTCSKKVGNAVARNRAKRRLREAARAVLPVEGRAGWTYVLIGRAEATAERPFDDLKADLRAALAQVHGTKVT